MAENKHWSISQLFCAQVTKPQNTFFSITGQTALIYITKTELQSKKTKNKTQHRKSWSLKFFDTRNLKSLLFYFNSVSQEKNIHSFLAKDKVEQLQYLAWAIRQVPFLWLSRVWPLPLINSITPLSIITVKTVESWQNRDIGKIDGGRKEKGRRGEVQRVKGQKGEVQHVKLAVNVQDGRQLNCCVWLHRTTFTVVGSRALVP